MIGLLSPSLASAKVALRREISKPEKSVESEMPAVVAISAGVRNASAPFR